MSDDRWNFDTALVPMDGSGVLLYVPTYPGQVVSSVWSDIRHTWVLYGCESLSLPFEDDDVIVAWQPLPEPPANTSHSGDAS